ncbi:MAG: hypothetical protein AB7O62_13845 [Pirellulales bacterium]
MISAHQFFEAGWGSAVPPHDSPQLRPAANPWQRQTCPRLDLAKLWTARLFLTMQEVGYTQADIRDMEGNLRGVWPGWFGSDDVRWNTLGLDIWYRIREERAMLVFGPPGQSTGPSNDGDAHCREIERTFRLHQPLMREYSVWLRFDSTGRCVALCKYKRT